MRACDALRRPSPAIFGVDNEIAQPQPAYWLAGCTLEGAPAVKPFAETRTATMSPLRWLRSLAALAALVLGLLICCEDADARLEDAMIAGGSARTSMTFTSMVADDRTIRSPAAQPGYQGGSLGGLFNRPGLIGGFAAGFLGAGVLGLLFGHGMVGELSGTTSCLGLIFQLALIAMLARLIWTWWRADRAAAVADLSPRQLADAYGRSRHGVLPDIESYPSTDARPAQPKNDTVKN